MVTRNSLIMLAISVIALCTFVVMMQSAIHSHQHSTTSKSLHQLKHHLTGQAKNIFKKSVAQNKDVLFDSQITLTDKRNLILNLRYGYPATLRTNLGVIAAWANIDVTQWQFNVINTQAFSLSHIGQPDFDLNIYQTHCHLVYQQPSDPQHPPLITIYDSGCSN